MTLFQSLTLAVAAASLSACASSGAISAMQDDAPDPSAQSVLLVFEDGELVRTEGDGSIDDPTLYPLYSVAKPMTVAAALRLAEQRRLDPVADVRTIAPALAGLPAAITPLQLASHSSGIRHYRDGEAEGECRDLADAAARFVSNPLLFEPGEGTAYSSHGFVALSAVIASAHGTSFDAAMIALVFDPLGIDPQPGTKAEGFPGLSCKFGAGGYVASADDVARFATGLFAPDFLSARSRAMFLRGKPAYEARGRGPLGSARMWVRPERQAAIVLLVHGEQTPTLNRLEAAFEDEMARLSR